jgi:hypothetical protein
MQAMEVRLQATTMHGFQSFDVFPLIELQTDLPSRLES